MQVLNDCIPVVTATYRQLNCYCDTRENWQKLSFILQHLHYYKNIYGHIYPSNWFGTKVIPCNDDELQYDEFDDKDVFLYIEQDTSKTVYDGALKELFVNDVVAGKRNISLSNVGNENRQITRTPNSLIVKYLMEYDGLNSHALIDFQQAIHYDSTYQKRFKEVEYQLLRKQDKKHEASIRYEDYGKRFYLTVL